MAKKTNLITWLVIVFLLAIGSATALADTIYVDDNASPSGDGLSWPTAYKYLQDALDDAGSGDEIWVAAGTYRPDDDEAHHPDGTGSRYATFQLKNGVALYGGFPPVGDPNWIDRDPNTYESILSGDLDGNDDGFTNNDENSYHIVTGSSTNATAVLAGFTITAGNAVSSSWPHNFGGGMYSNSGSPTLTNCKFIGNKGGDGGGIFNGSSSPVLTNCKFIGNEGGHGGGMSNRFGSSPTLTNCLFTSNSAEYFGAGMLNATGSYSTIINCTFIGNQGSENGGGMSNIDDSNPTVTGCTFSGNSASRGGGMSNYSNNNSTVTNCIFSGNSADLGGGMYNIENSSPILVNCGFSGNSAVENGGGMHNHESSPMLTDCNFISNTATGGGGLNNSFNSSPTLTDCTFSDNSAVENGGGMFNYDSSDPVLTNCTFSGNSANYRGGGMRNDNSNPTLTNCTFSGNSAANNGGGMFNLYSSAMVTNCAFINNLSLYGGGMFNYDGKPMVNNCMFSGNSATLAGGGMYWIKGDPLIKNCRFEGNWAFDTGGGIRNDRSNGLISNCIFYGNSADYGGALYSIDTSPAVKNCTFTNNYATNFGGAMRNNKATIEVTNCILWGNIAADGNELYNSFSATVISYCDIAGCLPSGVWNTSLGTDGGGNIDAAPLFADSSNGNYHLKSRNGRWDPSANTGAGGWVMDRLHSPCIDTGNPDDAVGDEPLPNGNAINLGAFGGTEFASKSWTTVGGDLVVTDVVVQETAVAGRPMHVTWVVNNADPLNTIHAWFFDGVYLSTDDQWGIDDVLLTTVWRYDPVGSGQSYQAEADVIMPGVLPGDYYILVRSDVGNHVDEPGGEENNITVSESISVDIEELTVGTPIDSEFMDVERARYYRVTVVEGKDLETNLDDLDDAGTNELYISFETVPTRSQFDYRYPTNFAPDQTIRIPTNVGTYYILAYASSIPGTDPSAFSINAEYLPLEIVSITPDYSGNIEYSTPTVTIDGSGFEPNSIVVLRRSGQADIVPTETTFINTGTMYARFNLHGTAAGLWDLIVTNPDSQTVTFPFNVIEGGLPNLETQMILPSALGFHRRAVFWIEYANTGDAPMPAPLLKFHGSQDVLLPVDKSLDGPGLWTDNPPAGLTDTVQVLALGSGPDPGMLNPGDSGRIPIYYRGCKQPWDFSYPPIEFDIGVLEANDTTPIDWSEVEAEVRPDDIADDLWEAIWPQIKARIGPTWRDYLLTLDENARYLAQHGKRTHSVRELFDLEVIKALNGFIPPRTLTSTVDAYCPAPGLPLVFGRVAIDTITQRFTLESFGRGWSHIYDYSLTLPDNFTAVIERPDGTTRRFTRNTGYPWQSKEGDFGIFADMPGGAHQIREKSGLVWFFNSGGLLEYIEETNGNRITLTYTAGKLAAISHSNGDSFTIAYNADGYVENITDHIGRQTQYIYDSSGEHLVSVTSPGDITTSYEYKPVLSEPNDHALTSITFPDAMHVYFDYDTQGRLISQYRDGQAEKVELIYESFNKLIVRDLTGAETSLYYGLPRQLLKVVNPLGDNVSFNYNEDFSFAGMTGPDGSSSQVTFDDRGNLSGAKDPQGNTISMGYTADNYLAWLDDQKTNRTYFATDPSGNLTSMTYPDSSTELFTYDSSGNVLTWTNRRGDTVIYTYNTAGQVTGKDYSATPGINYQYTYDTAGNLTSTTDAGGTISMTYDSNTDWMTRIEYPEGYFFEFEYDSVGRRTKRTDQDGRIVNYIYDTLGRLDQMTDTNDILIVDYDYDTTGRMVRKTLGNGVYTTYEYNIAGQLTNLVNYDSTDTVISLFDYTYDENGNRTSMTTLDGTYSYGYDALGQLTTVTFPDSHVVEYIYDPAGNRIEVIDDGVSTAYITNIMNQYTDVGGTTYTYDEDGNMKTKTEGGVTRTYTYNIENRLIGVSTPTDTWTYTYDVFGNRIASTHNGVETSYVIDPVGFGNVTAEYDDTGDLIARYDHGYGLISRTDAADDPAYYTFDAIGSTSEVTDPVGIVLNSYTYDPFGISLSKLETVENPFEFVGRFGVMNETNGLEFMRARFYYPRLGRFFGMDALGVSIIKSNAYTYCSNGPLDSIDPLGLLDLPPLWDIRAQKVFVMNYWTQKHWILGGLAGTLLDLSPLQVGQDLGEAWGPQGTLSDRFKATGMAVLEVVGTITGTKSAQTALKAVPWAARTNEIISIIQKTQSIWQSIKTLLPMTTETIPNPPTQPGGSGSSGSVRSDDPNKKIGPRGFGTAGFIISDPSSIVYTVYFENEPNATAAALQVRIEDPLDTDLDWTTFELLEVGFGEFQITVPSGMSHHEDTLQIDGWTFNETEGWHIGETPLIVDVSADIDITTGLATWNIRSYDPNTGWEPEDAYAGFLPPDDANDVTHRGEGYVSFMIQLKPDLPSGTQITNTGDIYFDYNPVIKTNTVLNTIDDGGPNSYVLPLPATIEEDSFTVQWTGQDDNNGSGIAQYDIYASADEGPYTLWLSTLETSAVFNGQNRTTYAFYSVATDNVGNIEAAPAVPDAITTVSLNSPPFADAGADQVVSVGDNCVANVTLNGSGSSDPDGDVITYSWQINGQVIATGADPTIDIGLGIHPIELIVNDGQESSLPDQVLITVGDNTPPIITMNGDAAITLECGIDNYSEAGATAGDNCSGVVVVVTGGDTVDTSTSGVYEVTYTASDAAGNVAGISRIVNVVDTTPPLLDVTVTPEMLWPPNHKMVEIAVIKDATDNCGIAPTITLISIAMNEGDETNTYDPSYDDTTGDGHTLDDIQVDAEGNIYLRAERSGNGNGRVYAIIYKATDEAGNETQKTVTVIVPHSQP